MSERFVGDGCLRGIRPPVACRHLRPVALLTPAVSLAPVNVEPPAINTQNRACLSIRSFFNDIHNTSDQNGCCDNRLSSPSPIGAPMAGPRSMPRQRMGGQRPCRATTCRRRWRGWPGCLRSSPSQRRSRGSRTVGRTARSQEGSRDPVTGDPGRGPGPRQRRGRRKSPRPGGRRGVRERHDLTTDTGGCPTGP